MKIAYVGDFINHGKSLQTAGTSLVLLFSSIKDVEFIDVYCPLLNEKIEPFEPPNNVRINEYYRYDDSLSILRLLKVKWKKYDLLIFNILPTSFGDSSISNVSGLLIPIIASKVEKVNIVRVIYHNSVYTNDFVRLGYDSFYDRVRVFFLSFVEKVIFKNVDTYVLLNLYKERIDKLIGKNRVSYWDARYIEAITTLYLNNNFDTEEILKEKNEIPVILMHGYWGPQKNLELGLSALKNIKERGVKFKLIISGSINYHFPDYEGVFYEILKKYSEIIDKYIALVPEKKIMHLFVTADLLILPYNTPGGHSGVLEQAIFFKTPTIAIDFPEFREQASGCDSVTLKMANDLQESISKLLIEPILPRTIKVKENFQIAKDNITSHILDKLR